MKKLVLAFMMGAAAMAANAQVNYKVQTACHPQDVKHYDTELLRSRFMMDKVMAPDEINVTYTLYDRLIYGGAMPVNKTLKLEVFRELGPEITYFLERRELGVINTGGDGVVTVDGKEYPMKYKEALYVGCGNKEVTFKSNDATNPAKFYINSAPAYKSYVTQLITTDAKLQKANPKKYALGISDHYGKMEDSNDRIVNQLIGKSERRRYQPVADGTHGTGSRLCMEYHACPHAHSPHGSLLLLQPETRQRYLSPDGRTAGRTFDMAAQRTSHHFSRMVHPRCCRNQQLYFHLGYGR